MSWCVCVLVAGSCVCVCMHVRTFVAVFMLRSVEVVNGVHGVQFDLREVFITDPV